MRTIVLADLHLSKHTPSAVVNDFASLVAIHPGARIIVGGDLFDLSAEAPQRRTISEALAHSEILRTALGRHIDTGGELWFAAGNHDAEIGTLDNVRIASALRAAHASASRIHVSPWFFRLGGIHIEHGHMYDPDNALPHPLALEATSLGVHFVREFLAPAGAHAFLQATDGTPLRLLANAVRWYGLRTPHIVYRFFRAAFTGLIQSGRGYGGEHAAGLGKAREQAFAENACVSEQTMDHLLSLAAVPTLASTRGTVARLYLDRVFATASMGLAAIALARGDREIAAAVGGTGALTMFASWMAGADRYSGAVVERLRSRAHAVEQLTSAKLVIFGHTHREALESGYANTGSFAFAAAAPGRPYLEIEGPAEQPRAIRRHFRPA